MNLLMIDLLAYATQMGVILLVAMFVLAAVLVAVSLEK
jgi:hypothetical protein